MEEGRVMRLGLIYHQFLLRGGLEGYLLEFSARLKQAGHELHLVTADMPEKVEQALGATVHRVKVARGSPMLRMWQFDRIAARMAQELPVDVTVGFGRTTTHDLHRAGGGCHAVYSQLLPPWKRWAPKNRLELSLEKQLYTSGRTKRFIVNSAQVAKQLHAHYGTDENLFRVIHTAVDTQKFQPSEKRAELRANLCQLFKTDPARPAFLFVSLSHRRKGLDVLLDVWPEVDADLWIVGSPLSLAQRLKISRRKLTDHVRTLEVQRNVSLLYQTADWFIHPTLYDACANSALQSMACALPGIISAEDGVVDLLRDGENGILLEHPRDPAAVLTQIRRALQMSEAERVALGTKARETVLPLTWDAHLGKWMDVIAEL